MLNKKTIIVMFLLIFVFILLVDPLSAIFINNWYNGVTKESFINTQPIFTSFVRYFNISSDDYIFHSFIDLNGTTQLVSINQTCYNCYNGTQNQPYLAEGSLFYSAGDNKYVISYSNKSGYQREIAMEIFAENYTKFKSYDVDGGAFYVLSAVVDKYGGIWTIIDDEGILENFSKTNQVGTTFNNLCESSESDHAMTYDSVNNQVYINAGVVQCPYINKYAILIKKLPNPNKVYSYCTLEPYLGNLFVNQSNGDLYGITDWGSAPNANISIYKINFVENGTCTAEFYLDLSDLWNETAYDNNWNLRGITYNNNTNQFIGLMYNGSEDTYYYPSFRILNYSFPKTVKVDSTNDGIADISISELNSLQIHQSLNSTAINDWISSNCITDQCNLTINFSFDSHGILDYSNLNFTLDNKPTVTPTIIPSPSADDDNLNCTWESTYSDIDGDGANVIEYYWYLNGTYQKTNLTNQTLSYINTTAGDKWSCGVNITGGNRTTGLQISANTTIGDSTAPVMSNFAPNLSASYYTDLDVDIIVDCIDASSTIDSVIATYTSDGGSTFTNITNFALKGVNSYEGKIESPLTAGKTYNITHWFCKDDSGNGVTNNTETYNLTFESITRPAPVMSHFAPNLSASYYTDTNVYLIVDCENATDSQVSSVRATYTKDGSTFTNITNFALKGGISYEGYIENPLTNLATYNITHWFCIDETGTGATNKTETYNLTFTTSTRPTGGTTPTGGGGGSAIVTNVTEQLEEALLSLTCGNGICDKNENIFNCGDCKLNLDNLFCFDTNNPQCITTQFMFTNLLFYFLFILALLYIVRTQVFPKRRKKGENN